MHASFLWSQADLIAFFNEASILLVTISTTLRDSQKGSGKDLPFSPLWLSWLRSKGHGFR